MLPTVNWQCTGSTSRELRQAAEDFCGSVNIDDLLDLDDDAACRELSRRFCESTTQFDVVPESLANNGDHSQDDRSQFAFWIARSEASNA